MFSSEQKFSVNGSSKEMLFKTLDLALEMSGSSIDSYNLTDTGVVLYWHAVKGMNKLPRTKSVETLGNLIWDQLNNEDTKTLFRQNHPADDIDGSTKIGWKIFIPHYDDDHDSFYAVVKADLDWLYYHK